MQIPDPSRVEAQGQALHLALQTLFQPSLTIKLIAKNPINHCGRGHFHCETSTCDANGRILQSRVRHQKSSMVGVRSDNPGRPSQSVTTFDATGHVVGITEDVSEQSRCRQLIGPCSPATVCKAMRLRYVSIQRFGA